MSKTRKDIAEEAMKRYLDEPIKNITQAYYDDFVRENARSSAKVGLKTIVIRREVGKCCDWCASLAGEYEYGEQPADFFRRHDYCKCMVLFRSMKGKYTDVWSKKEFESEKAARIERVKELFGEMDAEIRRLKRIARDENRPCIDTLEIREKYKIDGKVLSDKNEYVIDGTKYVLDGKRNILEYTSDELETGKEIVNRIGGNLQMMPKINEPQGVKTPDYLLDGKYKIDKKTPTGGGKNTIYNNLRETKGQANYVALEINSCQLEKERIFSDIENGFRSERLKHLKGVIVLKNNRIINVFERI